MRPGRLDAVRSAAARRDAVGSAAARVARAALLAACCAGLGCVAEAIAQERDAGAAADADAGAPPDGGAATDAAAGDDAAPRPRPRPVVTAPRLNAPVSVPYPDGAEGSQDVVLELTVDAAGLVRGVRVVEGTRPFTTAAIREAAGLELQPAERDGVPVAARFLLRVTVAPTVAPPAGEASRAGAAAPEGRGPGSRTGAAAPIADPRPAPIEVKVKGEKAAAPREPAQTTLTATELDRMPGAFGDAFRAVEVLPGVVPMVSGLPYFFVRGATPGSSGYLLDGIRVPFLFHFAAGPSVVSPALIDRVDFYPGAYPARYGRHVGGIIAATTTAPSTRPRGEALVRVVDSGALVETPLAGGRVNVFAGGRYSYAGAILQLFAPDTVLRYWDYQAGASVALGRHDRIGVLAFGSSDFLGESDPDTGEERSVFATEFHRIDLRYDHAIQGGAKARIAATVGWDDSTLGDDGVVGSRMLGLRGDAEARLTDRLRLRAGTALNVEEFTTISLDALRPPPSDVLRGEEDGEEEEEDRITDEFPSRDAGTFGAYVDVVWQPVSPVEIVPGLRADVFGEDGQGRAALDPRLALRLKLLPMVRSVSLFGMAHQRPSLLVPVPGLEPPGANDELQEAIQWSQGLEVSLPEAFFASATFFHHSYSGMTDLTATCGTEVEECSLATRATGRSYGIELLLQRPLTKRLGGWIAYTLSRSERVAHAERFPADFDRPHVLHVVLGYELGPGWHAGARFTTYSGRPHSLLAFDDGGTEPTQIGKTNAVRLPAFHRLDLRLEKRWTIGRTGWMSVVLEGVNVTLTKETVDFDCQLADASGSGSSPSIECGRQEIGPITIPSLGLAGGF